jgi:acyl-CoA reductase-like NAD-dependent aldehyde dehydrogenase
VDPPDRAPTRIRSTDETSSIPIAATTPSSLRVALGFAEEGQRRLREATLDERLRAVRLVAESCGRRRDEIAWGLGTFRGTVRRDADWMTDVLIEWSGELGEFLSVAGARPGEDLLLPLPGASAWDCRLRWRSRGHAALFCSSTMDGPPAVAALCHAILSGTHAILRPSWRDAVTHLALDALVENGLGHYAQLVRWPSDEADSPSLNRQMLTHSRQSLVFCSNDTYFSLLKDAADPGTEMWYDLLRRSRRYGTGLPLVIVTPNADLDRVADELIEGARRGNGRFCLSSGPVLVVASCYDALLRRLIAEAGRLEGGDVLCDATDLGHLNAGERRSLEAGLARLGGRIEHGRLREGRAEVVIVADVPRESPCLSEEFPGPALFLIRVEDLDDAVELAQDRLKRNHRDAWTAVATHGDEDDFAAVSANVDSYRHIKGGVTAEVELLLPHQGSYFFLDLMRRCTCERSLEETGDERAAPG